MKYILFPLFWLFVASLLLLPLAMPLAIWWQPRFKFIRGLILADGLFLPPLIFLLSSAIQPEWKGDCPNGWIDCMVVNKLALTPLMLWAAAAWLADTDSLRTRQTLAPPKPWKVLGLLHGTVVCWACCLYLLVVMIEQARASYIGYHFERVQLWLLLPVCITISYSIRAGQLMRVSKLKLTTYLKSLWVAAPCWIASVILSKQLYAALPDKAPDRCFVVTAAASGHAALVGPFFFTTHRGGPRLANRQLVTFWAFEERWRRRAPASHAAFRRVYGRLGPMVARRIGRRWQADLVYLALKPAEMVAGLAVKGKARG